MTFHVFNNNELDRYKKEAKERWQHTKEYQDYAQCHNDDRANQTAAAQLMGIFAKLGSLREQSPTSPLVQEQIQALQQCISEHFYACDNAMLANLGQLYVNDERFTHNTTTLAEKAPQPLSNRPLTIIVTMPEPTQ